MAAAASNNLSASVEVSNVNEIEDGLGHKLSVSDLDVMLVTSNPYTIKYDYTVDGLSKNTEVKVTPVDGLNDAITYENDGNGNLVITPKPALPSLMEKQEFTGEAANGAVRVVLTGKGEAVRVHLDASVVDPQDTETLEDLILVAINDAKTKSEETQITEMEKIQASLGLPPDFKMPF